MSGIVFMKTQQLGVLRNFYTGQLGCQIWIEQADCLIFRHGNLLIGFCERDETDRDGLITFFFDTRDEIDELYDRFKSIAVSPPASNEKYRIYHFFASDPDGRKIEFQHFEHRVDRYCSGDKLLLTRRSVRDFEETEIPEEILNQILDISRFAPTSRNSQSYYFKLIEDRQILDRLAETRGKFSAPISKAPLAVAICSDPDLSKRHIQDGCIAAYHFMLAAWFSAMGTCWIAAMDRDDAKEMLKIPQNHYIATITPLGYPKQRIIKPPERKELSLFIRQ
jgi:nitroreductase/predicted lactoylglutathione lyase